MQKNILDYLFNIANIKPNSPSFIGETTLTFGELKDIAFRIGTRIYENKIYKEAILVFMKKSPEEIATFFGVVASGCYYVPIDEEIPENRIKLIIENIQTPLVIVDETTYEKAQKLIDNTKILLYSDAIKYEANEFAILDIYKKSLDIDPVYIMFTSGSTGIPKGVVVCHRSIIDYIEQLSQVIECSENTIFGNQTPLYSDASLKELYLTLKFGAKTYLIPKKLFAQPYALIEFLNENKINTICWTSSALVIISSFGTLNEIVPKYLKVICFGGELFRTDQLNKWRRALPNAIFYNLYGPTEITGVCCHYKLIREFNDNEIIPIGKPFDNCEILLLDGNTPAEEGEICVRGTRVALGYYNDPERTQKVFVQNPLITTYSDIIYRTGDIAKLDNEGNLVYISRIDRQIKHIGHRIELDEIELVVGQIDGVAMSGCIFDIDKDYIILYYTGTKDKLKLLIELKQKLPRYMLPTKLIHIEQLPFTATGKIDRIALQKLYERDFKNT